MNPQQPQNSKSLMILSGAKWRAAHQYTVDGVLGAGVRKVASFGTRFFNMDTWTARTLVKGLVEWAQKHPGQKPTKFDIEKWVYDANNVKIDKKQIVIASTPDELPLGMAMALVGGGYHEAWHTLRSRRTPIRLDEVLDPILSRWDSIPDWSGLGNALLTWGNIIEDIRIERLGCKQFPGSPMKMEELQDLILTQEAEGRAKAKKAKVQINENLATVNGAFRDLGLGYDTSLQRMAYRHYEKVSPVGFALVKNGPLTPLLEKAIGLTAKQDLDHLWLAMDVIAVLVAASQPPQGGEGDDMEEGTEGGEGDGQKSGKPSKKPGKNKPGKNGKGNKPSKKGAEGEEGSSKSGKGTPGEGEEGEEGSSPGEGEGDEEGEGEGEGSGKSEGDLEGENEPAKGAGGHHEVSQAEMEDFLFDLVQAIKSGANSGLKDLSDALEEAINGEVAGNTQNGEHPWRPANPQLDDVAFVTGGSAKASKAILDSVRKEIATIKTRLRSKFLEARRPMTLHGVPCGSDISERRMVDSILEMRCGQDPTRPDEMKINRPECSLAVAVVIDQSGSMSGMRADATRAMVAICDSLDALHCPILCVGPRNGRCDYSATYSEGCHRTSGVHVDVFKNWNEPMIQVLPRFSAVTAAGGTPLEDGIQYALQCLSFRKERFRLVIVITDGMPDRVDVCRRQIRQAEDAGVSIIGVGIGSQAKDVKTLFKLPIVVPTVAELPVILVKMIETIVFPRVGGRKISLDGVLGNGKISSKKSA